MKILVRYNDSTDETLHSTIGVTFHGILLRNPTTGQILKKFTKSYNNLIKGYGCELKTNEMHIAIKNCDEKYIALPSDLLFSQILILNENGNGSKNFLYVRHGKSKTQTQFLLQMKDTLPCTNQAKIGSTVPDALGDHVTTTASTVTVKQSGNKAKVPVSSSSSSGTNDSSTSISSKGSTKGSTTKINRRVQIIIAGAPASGKGTQCEFIKNTYGCVHLSTGDILREAVAAQTPVGMMAKEYMDSGKLVPDDVIIGIVQDRLAQDDCIERGWLLDGFPRTNEQALSLTNAGVQPDVFIFLNVPDDILVQRVTGRRTDIETGKIYHLQFSPPPPEIPSSRLLHRSDDTAEKVIVRLQQFHTNVNAVKDNYSDCTISIDGNQSPSIVSQCIIDAINTKLNIV